MKNNIIFKTALRYWWLFAIGILLAFASSGIDVYIADYVSKTTDALTNGTPINTAHLLIAVPGAILLAFAVIYCKSFATGLFSTYTISELKNVLVKKISDLKYAFVEDKGTGSFLARFNTDTAEAQLMLGEQIPEVVNESARFTVTFIYMLSLNWQLLLLAVAILPLSYFFLRNGSNKLNNAFQKRLEGEDLFANTAKDVIEGMVVERSYNLQKVSSKRIADTLANTLKYEYSRSKISSQLAALRSILEWTPIFICCIVGAIFAFNGKISVGNLVAFFLLLRGLSEPMQNLPFLIIDIRQSLVSVKRLNEIENAPEEPSGSVKCGSDNLTAISWKNITFGYNPEQIVLNSVNLSIPTGKSVALVGASGGGKTTVFKLLAGLYQPLEGEYLLYGEPIQNWDLSAARDKFSLVSQDVFLFPESIAENVSYGRPNVTQSEIEEVCRLAGIHDFIISLPQGYESQVGERGIKLSGGERQRISIARAFLKNSPIILLDEPTSALDIENEKIIQQALEQLAKGRTVITIAHRLSTIQNAGEILVLENGTIAERGSHEQLLSLDGVYSMLYRKQSEVAAHE